MSGGVSMKLSPGNTAVTTVMDCSGVNNVCHMCNVMMRTTCDMQISCYL